MGSGNCLYWAPGVFDLDDSGVAVVVGDVRANEENVRLAAKNCPTRAIRSTSSMDERRDPTVRPSRHPVNESRVHVQV